jgi:hypothetical protein
VAKIRLDPKLQAWVEARRRHHLSHAHVQMARELGMNPTKLGSLDNHRQQSWKQPLPQFIESLYEKQFGRTRPEIVVSIEERAAAHSNRQAAKRAERQRRREAESTSQPAQPQCETGDP